MPLSFRARSNYTLTYAPTNTRADGGVRNIKVVLKVPGYQLSYRNSYYTADARHPDPPMPLMHDPSMQHGAPNSSGLFFEAKVTPAGSATAPSFEEASSIQTFLPKAKSLRTKTVNAAGSGQPLTLQRDAMKVQHYTIDFAIIGRVAFRIICRRVQDYLS